jgi:hypothetical protein
MTRDIKQPFPTWIWCPQCGRIAPGGLVYSTGKCVVCTMKDEKKKDEKKKRP